MSLAWNCTDDSPYIAIAIQQIAQEHNLHLGKEPKFSELPVRLQSKVAQRAAFIKQNETKGAR